MRARTAGWLVVAGLLWAGCSSTDMHGGGGNNNTSNQSGDDAGTDPAQPTMMTDPPDAGPTMMTTQPDAALPATSRAIGDACNSSGQCSGGQCMAWIDGYCTTPSCTDTSCPAGSECFELSNTQTRCLKSCTSRADCRPNYACHSLGACVPACTATSCTAPEVCGANGLCGMPSCTATSCPSGQTCAASGQCIVNMTGGPGPGPGPACSGLPTRDCSGTNCADLLPFEPDLGPGYDDYAINGETLANQYRSYANRTLQMLIKHAGAYTACKTAGWNTGNGRPLGLGDMSESNGAIPGTSIGQPGHPGGTHVNGRDMDIGYAQITGTNNYLRPICPYISGGVDQNHCVGEPDNLDVWRTAMFIGSLLASPRVRVIGCDGKVGPKLAQVMPTLCAQNWLPQAACQNMSKLAYEPTNMGLGWYYFHHHHFHVSSQ